MFSNTPILNPKLKPFDTQKAALQHLNYKNLIIPDTTITLTFVNNWDDRYMSQDDFYLIDSGGYAASKVYETATTMNGRSHKFRR
ncbi:hypothetical protein HDU97_010426 [Phlyctochytrium planicorne]|nr:hypothetical protein HDU97_010426 [Phlyctochytrium planicorne]